MREGNVNPRGPSQKYPDSTSSIVNDPKSVDQFHQGSDLNASIFAQHHSLGANPNQASPGSHIHDGSTSKLIPASSITEFNGFQPYVPVWTASVTNPVLNNGFIAGKYTLASKLVFFTIHLILGSTTTIGSGIYSFSVPVPIIAANPWYTCSGIVRQNSSGLSWNYNCWLDPNVNTVARMIFFQAGGSNGISNTLPVTWAVNDTFILSGFYEAA